MTARYSWQLSINRLRKQVGMLGSKMIIADSLLRISICQPFCRETGH
jgi:hypothetical protein